MRPRIAQELELLRLHYKEVEHLELAGEDWFMLPRYPLPPGWLIGAEVTAQTPVVFLVPASYPGSAPYGFLAPAGMNFNGVSPGNAGPPPKVPPFQGNWMHFSWSVERWSPAMDVSNGSNLLAWSRSFRQRFREGA